MSPPGSWPGSAVARRGGWRKSSSATCRRCWPAPRCCTPTRHPAAPPVPCRMCTWPAPNTSPSCTSATAQQPPSTPAVSSQNSPGVLVRDGYVGYEHLKAVHAWCGAHILRDLRSISDADPDGQVWAIAMANTLLEANRAAHEARERGADRLEEATLKRIRNYYLGAL